MLLYSNQGRKNDFSRIVFKQSVGNLWKDVNKRLFGLVFMPLKLVILCLFLYILKDELIFIQSSIKCQAKELFLLVFK